MTEKPFHVLLVEDDPGHAGLIRRAFRSRPERVELTVAGTVREAHRCLDQFSPDLLIVDYRLPDGEGLELLSGDKELLPFPVIVMTACGNEQAAVKAMKTGALDYVVKSVATLAGMPRIADRALRQWEHLCARRKAEDELRRAHDELELRVRERTAELQRVNEILRHEISQRKRAEEVLRESETQMRMILDGLPEMVLHLDKNLRVLWANKAAHDMNPDVTALTCYEASSDRATPCQGCPCLRALATGKMESGTVELPIAPDRPENNYWEHTAVPLRDSHGKAITAILIARNVSDRKRTEEEARQHLAELAHAGRLSTVGEMIAEVTHELGQPLYAISNYAQACSEVARFIADGRGDDLLKWTDQILQQTRRTARILARLRRFVRKTPPHRSTVKMNDLIEEVLGLIEGTARQRRVQTRFEPARPLPPVVVDRVQIEQVIVNLVHNAIDAMDDTETDRRKLLIRTSHDGEDAVQVVVCDTGSGISTENLSHIFQPFFTTKNGGMGMGLAICRSIVEDHGGSLWAAGNPDRGTTFSFTIPFLGQEGS